MQEPEVLVDGDVLGAQLDDVEARIEEEGEFEVRGFVGREDGDVEGLVLFIGRWLVG